MARKKRGNGKRETVDYRHADAKRPNIPPAKMAAEGTVPVVAKARYAYNPHLSPSLRFDPTGAADRLETLVSEAGRRTLTTDERARLTEALRAQQPWLEWAAKREQHERGAFDVDPVALHIHERVSAQAIVRIAAREDVQRDLFADPQQPYQEAIQFYKHDVDWANRLILGDSLQVMSSLARRENLAGKVQMVYVDPPYGIRFGSNFQSELGKRDLRDSDDDLSREPEVIRAFRDTWELGLHSYLSYLRDRSIIARELLSQSGSLFIQIGDANVHHVREVLDEVFGASNFVAQIVVQKTGGLGASGLKSVADYLLWYAKSRPEMKYRQLYHRKVLMVGDGSGARYNQLAHRESGLLRPMTRAERDDPSLVTDDWRPFQLDNLTSGAFRENTTVPFEFCGESFHPGMNSCWKTTVEGLGRLAGAERIQKAGRTIRYVRYLDDLAAYEITNIWSDVAGSPQKVYVVQTSPAVIERCMLMVTDPGDLVLDPTCGSGTTPYVAEAWGRRWIGIDTSRVAISVARQRIVTSRFDYFKVKGHDRGPSASPARGFEYKTLPYVKLGSIANNRELDAVFAKHENVASEALARCNEALRQVGRDVRRELQTKLKETQKEGGKRAIGEAERRRWLLPTEKFESWNVPFDTDPLWPASLRKAVLAFREVWASRMKDVNECIAANADQVQLVDDPERLSAVVRVAGPFTVEGVRPEELALGEQGLFDPTPNEFEPEDVQPVENVNAYLARMVQLLKGDGVTFLNNQRKKFARLEPVYEQSTGSLVHAEGAWEGDDTAVNNVAIGFGPQYGPITALQVEQTVRAARRYDELVVAGFSFSADASATIQEAQHPKLRIHQAYIRPDVNPGMDGLLKDTPDSQLFTVFGQPDLAVRHSNGSEFVVTLKGVDIYDPVKNVVRSAGADKVAAWFLDGDFDGRCFCISQAFFPNQNAWQALAKALKSIADPDTFERFKGVESLPFHAGKHGRVAVKVIDPRGNEVMAVRPLS